MTQTIEQPAQQNGQQLATRQAYNPIAPVGSAGALKGLLDSQSKGIAMALPRHVTPERLIKTMLVAANRTPDLLQCTQASILETINRAAELGLDLSGTLGEAYPVPFNNRIKWKDANGREQEMWAKQCQLIIGYRGYAKLARQTGEIKRIEADVVCANDTFTFRKGSDARCDFTPNLTGDRGEPIGAYAYVQFKDGGEQFDFMPCSDIEKIRKRSKAGSDKQGNAIGAWKSDWDEMAKKTVFRRVAKWLPLSTEKFVAAMEHDNSDTDIHDVVSVENVAPPRSGVTALLDQVRGNQQSQPAEQFVDSDTGELSEPSAQDAATGNTQDSDDSTLSHEPMDAGNSGGVAKIVLTELPDVMPNEADEEWFKAAIIQKNGCDEDVARRIIRVRLPKQFAKLSDGERSEAYSKLLAGAMKL